MIQSVQNKLVIWKNSNFEISFEINKKKSEYYLVSCKRTKIAESENIIEEPIKIETKCYSIDFVSVEPTKNPFQDVLTHQRNINVDSKREKWSKNKITLENEF